MVLSAKVGDTKASEVLLKFSPSMRLSCLPKHIKEGIWHVILYEIEPTTELIAYVCFMLPANDRGLLFLAGPKGILKKNRLEQPVLHLNSSPAFIAADSYIFTGNNTLFTQPRYNTDYNIRTRCETLYKVDAVIHFVTSTSEGDCEVDLGK